MKMAFRWFGEGDDSVPLRHIKQIPGVEGIVWALHDVPVGEEWPMDKIQAYRAQAERYGFHLEVVESVNVHEDIKLGLPSRERYIENYCRTIEKLAAVGVKTICYNFMPVFDWIRTDLYKALEDGSTALFYENALINRIGPDELVHRILANPSFSLPGWEPERLRGLAGLIEAYRGVTEEHLWRNLQYFLERIVPVAAAHDIRMALHPDDPPWSIFGLQRIMTSRDSIARLLRLVDSPYNGVTLCSGSLGANPANDIPAMAREFAGRIPFVHLRNVRVHENGDFVETSHRACDGTVDLVAVVRALHETGFDGYARPDHGRHIWDETCRPGYGLYDRALGIMYLWGVWDSLQREAAGGVSA
jgi:mannonate dehydratase